MALLCENPVDGDPCGVCESCQLFMKERHFSYYELDAATFGGKEDMVKLRDEAAFLSTSKKKIILLDESHDISRQGQDALLKQVEQCPDHLVYIFCTTEPDKMNSTLRNRCTEFQVSRVDGPVIASRLKEICQKESVGFDEQVLLEIANRSDGHVRNAINVVEEMLLLGEVNRANLDVVDKDFDNDIMDSIAYLGSDLSKVLDAYRKISPYIHAVDMYNRLITVISDACKLLYGFAEFTPTRLAGLTRLKDAHGAKLLEFLNYLVSRDKFIDRIGVQSDLIVMHYKFASGGFVPQQSSITLPSSAVVSAEPTQQSQPSTDSTGSLFYTELSKMSLKDRSRVLREQRGSRKVTVKEEPERVPVEWPLPKEDRPGQGVYDDRVLSPQDFSRNLVGGRSGGLQQVDSRPAQ